MAATVLLVLSLMIPSSVGAQKADTVSQATGVRRIDIVASWGGLGPAEYEHTIIQRNGNTFNGVDDRYVEAAKIEALIAALIAEPQREPSPSLIAAQADEYNVDYFAKEGLRQCAGDGADLREVQAHSRNSLTMFRINVDGWVRNIARKPFILMTTRLKR
jgi:hypothetical protein